MITLHELKKLELDANELLAEALSGISTLTGERTKNKEEFELKSRELKRLKRSKKRAKDNIQFYKLISTYISSGVQMEGLKEQRNQLMVRLSSIREREAKALIGS
jgi:hypothetical protein